MNDDIEIKNTSGLNPSELVLATPWQRYWARNVDVLFSAALAAIALGYFFPQWWDPDGWVSTDSSGYLSGFVFIFFGQIIDTAIYSVFGVTAGKLITGSIILHVENRRLTFFEYLTRNFQVWLFGLGMAIPLLSLIAMVISKGHAEDLATGTRWDRQCNTKVYSSVLPANNTLRLTIAAGTYIILIGVFIWLGSLGTTESAATQLSRTVETYEEKMKREAASVTTEVLNDAVQIDDASYGPDNVFEYRYTLYTSDITGLSTDEIDAYLSEMRTTIVPSACENLRDWIINHDTTIRYRYQDKNKNYVGSIDVTPVDCQ